VADAGTSLRQALSAIASRLLQAGIERARAEARLLAAQALGVKLETVVGDDTRVLTADEMLRLEALAARRGRREPMAQILGQREFFGRKFRVTADVLTPRPDSETLIEAVLAQELDRSAPLRLLELGVGSGCLLLTLLAELPNAQGTGVDISPAALVVAKQNASALGLAARCALVEGDWSQAVEGRFDIVLSNPPYIPSHDIERLEPEVARYEPKLALDGGDDGLLFYRRLAADLQRLLVGGGLVAVEIGQGQGSAVGRLFQEAGLWLLPARADLAGIERCILARAPETVNPA
jgi:release factor glutamine methyltransferase